MKRWLKNLLKSRLHSVFAVGQRCGVDLLPRHFYSEVPNLQALRRTAAWRQPYSMTGVAGADLSSQTEWLKTFLLPEILVSMAEGQVHKNACEQNGEPGFGVIEADVLYAFVRHYKPLRIVQIGCGVSTAVCRMAAAAAGYRPAITCIEPYPNMFLRQLADVGEIVLCAEKVEQCDPAFIEQLSAGDLFFVDSTHTLGPAGEVTRIILEFLPRLPEGVIIHFHDILFPYDYTPDVLNGALFFPHESPLLHAFLALNPEFRILASLSMLHHGTESLRAILPHYAPAKHADGIRISSGHFPSSLYACRSKSVPQVRQSNESTDKSKALQSRKLNNPNFG
jgi:hypothetical protein